MAAMRRVAAAVAVVLLLLMCVSATSARLSQHVSQSAVMAGNSARRLAENVMSSDHTLSRCMLDPMCMLFDGFAQEYHRRDREMLGMSEEGFEEAPRHRTVWNGGTEEEEGMHVTNHERPSLDRARSPAPLPHRQRTVRSENGTESTSRAPRAPALEPGDVEEVDGILHKYEWHQADPRCNGVGIGKGFKRNVCSLQNCYPTKLRCPPDFTLEPNPRAYGGALSQCHVESVACEDEQFDFPEWALTTILSIVCVDGRTHHPDDGDLQHCSIGELTAGTYWYNFTRSTEEFCVQDQLECPRRCNKLSVRCASHQYACPEHEDHRCVEGFIYCGTTPRRCAGEMIRCEDFHHVTCDDALDECGSWRLACDGVDQCKRGENLACNTTRYNIPLLECGGSPQVCSSYYISCDGEAVRMDEIAVLDGSPPVPTRHAGGERPRAHVSCVDPPESLRMYRPLVMCEDSIPKCELEVFCLLEGRGGADPEKKFLECSNSSSVWRYNGTDAVCVLQDESYFNNTNVGVEALPFPQSDKDWEDAVITQVGKCDSGLEYAQCRYDNITSDGFPRCQNTTLSCHTRKWRDEYPRADRLQACEGNITYTEESVYCEDEEVFCTAPERCDVVRKDCEEPFDPCYIAEWDCADESPKDCRYHNYTCVDPCWKRDGEWNCTCPIDATGSKCDHYRPYTCDFTLVSPRLQCEQDADLELLDHDAICIEVSVRQTLELEYMMQCKFENMTDVDPQSNETFRYFVFQPNGTFAINEEVKLGADEYYHEDMEVLLSVFNFNRMTDLSAGMRQQLSREQILGLEPIRFHLDIYQLYRYKRDRARYFAGGRMYIELDLFHDESMSLQRGQSARNPNRKFIDFTDAELIYEEEPLPSWAVQLFAFFYNPSLITVITVAAIAAIVRSKYTQHYEQRRLRTELQRDRERRLET